MNYTLHQLQVFLKIAQTGSITKAAEQLFLTQPAVSIQLKNFQDQFDLPLTEMIGRKIYITDFGREIAEASENILAGAREMNNRALAFKGLLTGVLRISVVSTAKYVLPAFLSGFIRGNEGVELSMDVSNRATVMGHLERNEVDFALISFLPDNIKLETLPLMLNKLYLVGSALDEDPTTLANLKSLPLIYREPGSGTRYLMDKFIEGYAIDARKKLELTSNEAVKQAVIAGLGYSIMPLIGLKNELENNEVRIIPFKGLPIAHSWNLVWLEGKKHSLAAKAFLSYMEQERESIIAQRFGWVDQY